MARHAAVISAVSLTCEISWALGLHGIIIAISYDQRMPQLRTSARYALPVLLLLVLYWPGLTTWFYQDDFGWLNLRHDVHSVSDLSRALFAPKAHGNMRPLGENAYWLASRLDLRRGTAAVSHLHVSTQAASLWLLGGIVRRLVEWPPAASLRAGLVAGQYRTGSGDGVEFDL